jgi:hypothetical protein
MLLYCYDYHEWTRNFIAQKIKDYAHANQILNYAVKSINIMRWNVKLILCYSSRWSSTVFR